MSSKRATIAIVLGVCLALALYFALHGARGGERHPMRAADTAPPASDAQVELGQTGTVPAPAPVEARAATTLPVADDDTERDVPRMHVLVRDGVDEAPLAGATVTFFDCAAPTPQRTDRDGVCLVREHAPAEPARLQVEATGHFHASVALLPQPSVVVVLDRAAILSGRVLAADTGAPVAGAEIALRHDRCVGCEPTRVRSGSDGSYELAAVPLRRRALLDTRAEGFAPTWREFALESDEPRVIMDLHLARGIEIAGRVEDWMSASGIAGARVGELMTDADGHFHGLALPRAETEELAFEIGAAGYALLRTAPVALRGDLVFRLPHPAFIEGRVSDASGQALAGAALSFSADGPNRSAGETSPLYELPAGWSYSLKEERERSDADGRYRLSVLPWSLNGTAVAGARGFAQQKVLIASIGEPDSVRNIDWSLTPGEANARVRGSVTLDGQHSAAFQGSVSWRGPTRAGSTPIVRGRYETEVEAGTLRLSASLDVFAERDPKEVLVNVDPASERTIDLDVAAPPATISGAVRFEDGGPVPGAYVFASCPLQTGIPIGLLDRAITDARGAFTLHVSDIGRTFDVSTEDYEQNQLERKGVQPGARDVDFTLPRGYRAFVRLRDARTGKALALDEDAQLLVRGEPQYGFERWPSVGSVPDADGSYLFRFTRREVDLLALPRAAALPQYGAALLRHAQLDPHEPVHLELVLERGVDVELQLAEGVAAWPADHELLLVTEELYGSFLAKKQRERFTSPFDQLATECSVNFDASGHAALHGLAPGNYRFESIPRNLVVDPELVLVDEHTLPVVVHWSAK